MVLAVSESGFYRSLKPSPKGQRQQQLLVNIQDILHEHEDNENYGVQHMMLALTQKGITASYRTVYRIMKKHELCPVWDCFNGVIVGLAMDDNMRKELCIQAFENACRARIETRAGGAPARHSSVLIVPMRN